MSKAKIEPDALRVLMGETKPENPAEGAPTVTTAAPMAAARRRTSKRDKHVQLLLTGELYDAFKGKAEALGVSFNQLANEALEAYLEKL